jgi:hypothetical protein
MASSVNIGWHTPGPWRVDFGGIYIRAEDGTRICEYGIDEPYEANARLIAAAPELLAALQRIASSDNPYEPCGWAIKTAQAAIAKATGATP